MSEGGGLTRPNAKPTSGPAVHCHTGGLRSPTTHCATTGSHRIGGGLVAAPVRNGRLVAAVRQVLGGLGVSYYAIIYVSYIGRAAVRQVLGGLGLLSATAAFVLNYSRMPQSAWNKWARGKAHAAIDQQAPIVVHVHAAAEQSRARSNGEAGGARTDRSTGRSAPRQMACTKASASADVFFCS